MKRSLWGAETVLPQRLADLPIIDSHVHFWDPAGLDYGWLRNLAIGGPRLPGDYWEATNGVRVERLVFVEAACRRDQCREEAAWVEKLAAMEPRIGGIVAFAPMDDEKALARTLEDFSHRRLVKGIRHLIQSERDVEFCLRRPFVAGVKMLAQAKLTFDVGARAEQLPAVVKLVEQCPQVSFVLNHLGNPNIKQGAFERWSQDIQKLAALPNISCKVSGAATSLDWSTGTIEQLRPYVNQVLAQFGFKRVLFGSDWPVCTLACSFRRWLEAVGEITNGCTKAERVRLFSKNARKIYGLR
ncbi:MAG TPA: amidohydrolase family protein [Candidatus Paceibacterota bacterium]|nr:amidohydrolase family protein [Candidatus Paceibacterota bacterium]